MKAISAFGILDTFGGILVSDDFGGYLSDDQQLVGVQQCLSHLLRYLGDAYYLDPDTQMWARQVGDALRTAIHALTPPAGAAPASTRTSSPAPDTASAKVWR